MRTVVDQKAIFRAVWMLAACLGASLVPFRADAAPTAVPLTLMDISGKAVAPLALSGTAPRVFFFLSRTCPLCSEYAPEIGRICGAYGPRGVAFSIVYTDADLSPAGARQDCTRHGYPCTALLDPKHRLSGRLGATVTPEAAVVGPDGHILYRGRIDNRLLSWGVTHDPNVADLSAALEAIRQGSPVARPWHPAIGCAIPQAVTSRTAP